MQLQCDCFSKAQTVCSLSGELVPILQHKEPVKYQGEKEQRFWTPFFKNVMLLPNGFLYLSLMFLQNLV